MYLSLSALRRSWLFRVILFAFGLLLYFVVGGIFGPYTTTAFQSGQLSNFFAGVTGLVVAFMGVPLIVIAVLPEHPRDNLWSLQTCAFGQWFCGIMIVIVPGQFAWYLFHEIYLPRCGDGPLSRCAPVIILILFSAAVSIGTVAIALANYLINPSPPHKQTR